MVINPTRLKIQSISARPTQLDQAATMATPILAKSTQPKTPATSVTSVKGEVQVSASATQAQLSRRLGQQFKPEPAEKKKANNPILTATRLKLHDYVSAVGRNSRAIAPTTLSTGSGNDVVNIQMGDDERVHVSVNGKEAWSGTVAKFKKLTIDTGEGNDVVTNLVDGAWIETGKGIDTVINRGSNTNISTGEGDDNVFNLSSRPGTSFFGPPKIYSPYEANNNVIETGEGRDTVVNEGSGNTINTGSGDDRLRTNMGSGNKFNTGEGKDRVETDPWSGAFNTFKDPDEVEYKIDPII